MAFQLLFMSGILKNPVFLKSEAKYIDAWELSL